MVTKRRSPHSKSSGGIRRSSMVPGSTDWSEEGTAPIEGIASSLNLMPQNRHRIACSLISSAQ